MSPLRKYGMLCRVLVAFGVMGGATSAACAQRWEAVEWRVKDGRGQFYRTTFSGEEVVLRRGDARRRVPAFHQKNFPEPESGCGPTAVLNWMLWMRELGCFGEAENGADSAVFARHIFWEIDREIREMRKEDLPSRNGSNRAQIAAAMDRLARDWSGGTVRMAVRAYETPLKMVDLLSFIRGQRAGILIGQVVENAQTGEAGDFHALNLVAVDRGGGLMVNNWGERVYGYLRTYPDGQYFYPENAEQAGLKIIEALCMVPVHIGEALP